MAKNALYVSFSQITPEIWEIRGKIICTKSAWDGLLSEVTSVVVCQRYTLLDHWVT